MLRPFLGGIPYLYKLLARNISYHKINAHTNGTFITQKVNLVGKSNQPLVNPFGLSLSLHVKLLFVFTHNHFPPSNESMWLSLELNPPIIANVVEEITPLPWHNYGPHTPSRST